MRVTGTTYEKITDSLEKQGNSYRTLRMEGFAPNIVAIAYCWIMGDSVWGKPGASAVDRTWDVGGLEV